MLLADTVILDQRESITCETFLFLLIPFSTPDHSSDMNQKQEQHGHE